MTPQTATAWILILPALVSLLLSPGTLAMPKAQMASYRETVREMFLFGWNNYLDHAFPMDELNPIRCGGRGRDYMNPQNIGINDVLGDFSLTLIDAMDTLAIMGEHAEFVRAVSLAKQYVDFARRANTVQVFETNIRILGGLLSSHILATDARWNSTVPGYAGELLELALDIGERLLPAFNRTKTGLPFARVNLVYGVPRREINQTCTAGAGSLILEFGVLSRLTGDSRFEDAAKQTLKNLWSRRSLLNLIGNNIDINTGKWIDPTSGIGAGIDSFFEYLLKAYVLFGDDEYLDIFNEAYAAVMRYIRDPNGIIYSQINMYTGEKVATWIDSLSAFFPGLQVLYGDLDNAKRLHELYFTIWRRFNALPERWDYHQRTPIIPFYPLRPELMESTYMLYQATKDTYYLHAGAQMISDLQKYARKQCGFATIHNLNIMSNDDRMESFFLSETLKYLYLLFDEDHLLNKHDGHFIFTTEGHMLTLDGKLTNSKGTKSLQKCMAPAPRFHPFRTPPLSDIDIHLINSIVGWSPEMLDLMPGECPALHHSPMMNFEPMEMQIILKPPSPSGVDDFPVVTVLNSGDLLFDTLHNVRVLFVSSSPEEATISKVNDFVIPQGVNIIVKQESMLAVNQNQPFIDEFNVGVMRVYDESMLSVGSRAVFTPYEIMPATFGPRINELGVDGFLEYLSDHPKFCEPVPTRYHPQIKDKIVLILRGNCTFSEKSLYAQVAGAKAVIIINTESTLYPMSGMDTNQMAHFLQKQFNLFPLPPNETITLQYLHRIPVAMLRLHDGLQLTRHLLLDRHMVHVHLRNQPAAFQLTDRHLLSIQHKRINNLAIVNQQEYQWLVETKGRPIRFKRRLLHPAMRWSCLHQCSLSPLLCCA